jgi:MraZ protein
MGAIGMLLTGTYQRALDEKHRLPIPKPLRDQLQAGGRLYLTPGLDGCLAIYPEAAFATLAERLGAASPGSRDVRDYSRLFYSQAASAIPDGQWRVRIPMELVQWAALRGGVAIIGVRDHVEVWSAEKWEEYASQCDSRYDQLAELAFIAAPGARTEAVDESTDRERGDFSTARPK